MSGRRQAYDATRRGFQASSPIGCLGSKDAGGRSAFMSRTHDSAYNRDEEMKPAAPRARSEPKGAKGAARTTKTLTDPASGGAQKAGHAPNQAEADLTDGAEARRS